MIIRTILLATPGTETSAAQLGSWVLCPNLPFASQGRTRARGGVGTKGTRPRPPQPGPHQEGKYPGIGTTVRIQTACPHAGPCPCSCPSRPSCSSAGLPGNHRPRASMRPLPQRQLVGTASPVIGRRLRR
ncbi:hypothetical protein N657DRAFT_100199 [Parathielavia appendiculata]|uniref:Uncharacterized protein n=1 Tax=Parathielavia appendiculata TaxID=2587402 RepID=A0AAN6TW41_9PEZI|nr:hypothetical protein N657DRAFT_100199 [Parathielavia appendiculata]